MTYPWLTPCWFRELLQFCGQEDLTLQDTLPRLAPFTTNDVFLMDAFIEASFDRHELRLLNECRMFLRVITLSDICTADLRYITHEAMYGRPQPRHRNLGGVNFSL